MIRSLSDNLPALRGDGQKLEIPGLIRVTTHLLARQLRHLEEAFVKEGGLRERRTRARLRERGKSGA